MRTRTLLLLLLTLGAVAPARARSEPEPPARLHVVTTLGVLADLARAVGGDAVEVVALASPLQDPHFVEPRPTLMSEAREADVFVEVGLQLELWSERVVSGSGNPRIQAGQPGRVIASTGVRTLELPAVLSREWGDVHPYGNPHVWLDPLNTKTMARNIADALARVDPARADAYRANLAAFEATIDERVFGAALVREVGGDKLSRLARGGRLFEFLERRGLAGSLGGWMAKGAALRGRPVVSYHKTFIYFATWLGMEIPIEIEEKPGIPPSARHRDHVVEVMEQRGVRTVLQAVFYDETAADYLAGRTGATVVASPIDVGEDAGVPDYLTMMDRLIEGLVASEGARH